MKKTVLLSLFIFSGCSIIDISSTNSNPKVDSRSNPSNGFILEDLNQSELNSTSYKLMNPPSNLSDRFSIYDINHKKDKL